MVRPISMSTQLKLLSGVIWELPRLALMQVSNSIHFNRLITQSISKPNVHLKHMALSTPERTQDYSNYSTPNMKVGFIYSKGLIVPRVPCLLNIKTGCIPGICIHTVYMYIYTYMIISMYICTHMIIYSYWVTPKMKIREDGTDPILICTYISNA